MRVDDESQSVAPGAETDALSRRTHARMPDIRRMDLSRPQDRRDGERTSPNKPHRGQRRRHVRVGSQTERHRFHVAHPVERAQSGTLGAVHRMGRRDIPRSLHRRMEHDCSHRWFRPGLHGGRDWAAQRDEHDALGRADRRRYAGASLGEILRPRRSDSVLDRKGGLARISVAGSYGHRHVDQRGRGASTRPVGSTRRLGNPVPHAQLHLGYCRWRFHRAGFA